MPPQPLMVGSLAPDFSLSCTTRACDGAHTASLADYRGRWLMLVFYPRDFSLVCPTELTALSARIEEFQKRGCDLLGISTDTVDTHNQWIAAPRSQGGLAGLSFPLASDPDGVACRAYGVFLEWQKLALRGLFIIDPNGVLQYATVHNTSVGRRSDEILRVLDALQSGGLCPENWTGGSAPLDTGTAIVPGSVLAHYRFESKLGSGAFGAVFRARDLKLERTVAIKVVQTDKSSTPASVMKEARTAAALQHPHVCTIFSVDDSEGVPLIVMEHVGGGSLSEVMKAGPLALPRAKELALQIARGMAAAHAAGIIHGDLKPDNILISEAGLAKISDFGLARREAKLDIDSATLTWSEALTDGVSGTPGYMAPELLEGRPSSAASDVFALGIILYEMLTGRRAIEGSGVLEIIKRVRELDGDRLAAEVPEELRNVVRRSLQRDPKRRPSAEALANELAASA